MNPRIKLAAAVTKVCDSKCGLAPYFGSVLRGLVRKESTTVPTLAVTHNGILYWNAEFVAGISVDECAYSLIHESMHVVLRHAERAAKFFGVTLGTRTSDPEMFEKFSAANIAQDACINEEIAKTWGIPDWWVTPASLKQPENLIFEERLRRMLEEKKSGKKAGKKPGEGQGQGEKTGPGTGSCGSCSGHAAPGEPASGQSGAEQGRSKAEIDRMLRGVAEGVAAHAAAKGRGSVPASLERWADEALAPAKVDWRVKLQRIVRYAVAYRPGSVDLTWTKPSRRQGGVGFGVGIGILPSYRSPVAHVGVIVDTSGSMSGAQLGEALQEIEGVLKAQNADVTVCACDAAVSGIKTLHKISDVAPLLTGGGGTDMRPAFEALLSRKPRPEIVIVVTDGYLGPGVPTEQPDGVEVIWVLVGDSVGTPATWGEQIRVDADGAHDIETAA